VAEIPKEGNQIFICYRREESTAETGRIYDRLVRKFGKRAVFKDVDSIPPGTDFRLYIDSEVGKCEVVLVVIGDQWLELTDQAGNRRLDAVDDYVRIEIEYALRRNIPVIPLWVRRTRALSAASLPESIKKLAFHQGVRIDHDQNFHADVSRLIKRLQKDIFVSVPTNVAKPRRRHKAKPERDTSADQASPKRSKATEFLRSLWRGLPSQPASIETDSADRPADRQDVQQGRLSGAWGLVLIFPWLVTCLTAGVLLNEDFVPALLQNLLEPALWGLAMSLLQAPVLRFVTPLTRWWILGTVAGAIAAGLVYYLIGLQWEMSSKFFEPYAKELAFIKPVQPVLTFLMLRWPLVSLFQWLILRRFFRQAWLWPVVTTAGAAMWSLLILSCIYGKSANEIFIMNVLCAGVFIGGAQGICLITFKKR